METFLDMLAVSSAGLMIGTELAVAVFVNPVVELLGPEGGAAATRLFARRLGKAMPFWYGLTLLLMLAGAWMQRHQAGAAWLFAACLLWVLAIAASILFLVPINNRIAAMEDGAFSAALKQEHRRWDALHRWRVVVLAAAFAALLAGLRI